MPDPTTIPHEPSRVSIPALAVGFATIAVGIAVSLVAGWLLLASTGTPANAPNNAARPGIDGPVQETNSPDRLAAYRREEASRLNGYGRDPSTGAIHIPIEQAMRILAQGRAR
ncbi:MAG TPA: hypothetical protein VH040_09270 [Usitatibacter sp.]|jgi:hypothetical protein|nr:hypothetical protein [Usitatibacter sp.]